MGAVPLLLLALASASASGRLTILSNVDCPRAAELGASVQRLLGAAPAAPATLSISPAAGSLVVRLVDGGGALVAERTWPAAGPCDGTSEAIAVVAATWLGDLPPVTNDVAAPPPAAPAAADPETPGVVVATPAPPLSAHKLAGTLLVGAGIASPIAGPNNGLIAWALPSVKVAGQLRGTGATTGFGEIGLVADVPRARNSVSWDRFTVEPMGGVAFRAEGTTISVGGGLSVGVLEIDERSFGSSIYRWFDIAAIAEARAGLTLGPAPRDLGLWAALRGRAALRDGGYSGQGPWGPDSRYELALLVGGDISFLP